MCLHCLLNCALAFVASLPVIGLLVSWLRRYIRQHPQCTLICSKQEKLRNGDTITVGNDVFEYKVTAGHRTKDGNVTINVVNATSRTDVAMATDEVIGSRHHTCGCHGARGRVVLRG